MIRHTFWTFVIFLPFFLNCWPVLADDTSYVVGVLGDSISVAANSSNPGNNSQYSWAGGMDSRQRVVSHALRIKALISRPLTVVNQAVSGSETKHLASQVEKLLPKKPDYVTLLIGANDLCRASDPWTPSESVAHVRSAIDKLIGANVGVKIFLAAVPNMLHLREIGAQNGCQGIWNLTNLCSPLLSSRRTEADRIEFARKLDSLNLEMEAMASSYPDNVRFDSTTAVYEFSWANISKLDCFHPSIDGQNKLAEMTFDPSWN